jgi:uncharacterized membrane protein YphA (DoxX/SURF4 family)
MGNAEGVISGLLRRRDLAFDLLRIYMGFGLFAKGIYFVTDREFISGLILDQGQFHFASTFLAHYIPLAHIAGGAMLALGLLTRLAVVFQLPVLGGAVFLAYAGEGLFTHGQTFEFATLVAVLLLLLLLHGAGRLSYDFHVWHGESQGGPTAWRWLEARFERFKEHALDLLRIYLGIALFAMGIFFLIDRDFLPGVLEGQGTLQTLQTPLNNLVPLVHIVAGGLLAAGLLSRIAALVQIPVLAGAVYVYLDDGFFTPAQTLEFVTLVLFLLVLLAVFPPGRLSATRALWPLKTA